jgi:hypothetical protein
MIVAGSAKAQGSRQNPLSWVRAAQSNQSEGQSDAKGDQQLEHPVPHRGDPTSSSFVFESRPGGFLHAPSYGLASSHPGFFTRITQERHVKPPGLDLIGRALSLV